MALSEAIRDGLEKRLEKKRQNPADQLRIALRRWRAGQLRELLSHPDRVDLSVFNWEVWPIETQTMLDGRDITGTIFQASLTPEKALELEQAIRTGTLQYHGNSIWGSATRVFGAQLSAGNEEKEQYVRRGLEILNDRSKKPIEKVQGILSIPGFGDNVATGLVMVFHPYDFSLCNNRSRAALRSLGLPEKPLESFENAAATLQEGVGAEDRIELDWLLFDLSEGHEVPATAPRMWIEKSLVGTRSDRIQGPLEVGKALWSPRRAKDGGDIYHFMREVESGDLVLHLTDNQTFSGISRVSGRVQDLPDPPSSTPWSNEECWTVPLEDYQTLEPPLRKEQLFQPPFDARLRELLRQGEKNLFFTSDLKLRQGAYLTPCPQSLLSILKDAYSESTGRTLLPLQSGDGSAIGIKKEAVVTLQRLAAHTNSSEASVAELVDLLKRHKHLILEGPPGSGKTFVAEALGRYYTGNRLEGPRNARLVIVQFHQSYGYEDFVQGIRPETDDQTGSLRYGLRDGIFKDFCRRAGESSDHEPYVMLIDEINRGNISRIFGELLFLLEYRHEEVRLPYAEPTDPPFSIPRNVFLIGTMNTADRSLAQIDYALRRRFYFYPLMPVVNGKAPYLERWLTAGDGRDFPPAAKEVVRRLFLRLNQLILTELGPDFLVGHSYFMTKDMATFDGRQQVWKYAILPLLAEYFHNRQDRAQLLERFSFEAISAPGPSASDEMAAQ